MCDQAFRLKYDSTLTVALLTKQCVTFQFARKLTKCLRDVVIKVVDIPVIISSLMDSTDSAEPLGLEKINEIKDEEITQCTSSVMLMTQLLICIYLNV